MVEETHQAGAMENAQRWSIPFVGRTDELITMNAFLNLGDSEYMTSRMVVRGDSGTGKSFFVKEVVYEALNTHSADIACIYVDMSNDEFQSSRLISSILKISMVSASVSKKYPLSIPSSLTLGEYQEKVASRRAAGWSVLKGLSKAAASVFGMGEAVGTALEGSGVPSTEVEDILENYFVWVLKKVPVVLIIDNYQFMNHEVRFSLEEIIQRISKGIRFIVIDRTIDGHSEIVPPLQSLGSVDRLIELEKFTADETKSIVASVLSTDKASIDAIASDIYTKTSGLAKDVEFVLRQFQLASDSHPGKIDVLGLLATIDRLPLMHRQFLLVASLLDGGVKVDLARRAIRRITFETEDGDIDRVLTEMISQEYLRLNTDSGDRLRAGHERIVQSMRELSTDGFYDDVRRSLIEEFIAGLERKDDVESEAYLLHCLVGLQSVTELKKSLHFISRLIRAQHRQEQFAYLVNLAAEASEVIDLLPENTVALILDAMQKSSAFERGLQLIRALDDSGALGTENRALYRYKFLTQLYQYSEAAKVAETLGNDNWHAVYKINALLALERNDEARDIAYDNIQTGNITESEAVILRNTVTLFGSDQSLANLSRAGEFFDQTDSVFRSATVDTNRGLVYLCRGELGDATRYLERAIRKMESVGSREIFQAQFNLAIRYGLDTNYILAKQLLAKARTHVPSALLLDQNKIELADTVLDYVSGEIDELQASNRLKKSLIAIRGVQMPYLRRTLEHNIAVLSDSSEELDNDMPKRVASSEKVSLYLPIANKHLNDYLIVIPSVHWRY